MVQIRRPDPKTHVATPYNDSRCENQNSRNKAISIQKNALLAIFTKKKVLTKSVEAPVRLLLSS